MIIAAYAQAVAPPYLQLWVGIFDAATPPAPRFEVGGSAVTVTAVKPLGPIRDASNHSDGTPRNHFGVFRLDTSPLGASPHAISVVVGNERTSLTTQALPERIPSKMEGSFDILLCSCYSQPEDGNPLLQDVVARIKPPPRLTLMMGDQIYGDLPLFEDLPNSRSGIAKIIGAKYLRNWWPARERVPGLGRVLSLAPTMCVADDHEYWNNYPFAQGQLPQTWDAAGRALWRQAATALYEDYQLAGPPGAVQRIDIAPLSLLVVDLRSLRDERFEELLPQQYAPALSAWIDDLIAAKAAGTPLFGLLCSGQTLLARAAAEHRKEKMDAEMANYAQFGAWLLPEIERLAHARIPLVYVTGDVHWGRIARMKHLDNPSFVALYEIIASPSRLIRLPVIDAASEAWNAAKGLFGGGEPWPRHPTADAAPGSFGSNGKFRNEDPDFGPQRGDQVALLSFEQAGGGLDFKVTYYPVHADHAVRQARTSPVFKLRLG